MTKRLVDIDDELLRKARQVLETATMKDTVNGALAEIVTCSAHHLFVIEVQALHASEAIGVASP